MTNGYYVRAIWDDEVHVWVSESDIPGLVIEAETLQEFEDLMMALAPEMLAANTDLQSHRVSFEFTVSAHRQLALA